MMRLIRDVRATAALEFALIAPAMLVMFFGTISMGVSFWTLCALQAAAEQGARCSAISSTNCSSVPTGCDSGSAVVCYVETIATKQGVTTVTAGEVSVATTATAGVSFITVTINHANSFAGYSMTLHAVSSYPANSITWATYPPGT